jgi:hypothetical protein
VLRRADDSTYQSADVRPLSDDNRCRGSRTAIVRSTALITAAICEGDVQLDLSLTFSVGSVAMRAQRSVLDVATCRATVREWSIVARLRNRVLHKPRPGTDF